MVPPNAHVPTSPQHRRRHSTLRPRPHSLRQRWRVGGRRGITRDLQRPARGPSRRLRKDFTRQTGIPVQMRNGGDIELGEPDRRRGRRLARRRVHHRELAGDVAGGRRACSPRSTATLDAGPRAVPADDGDWTGIAARSTVLVYNTDLVARDQLPASIMELAGPAWQGRIGFPPAGADFQAIVSAVAHPGRARRPAVAGGPQDQRRASTRATPTCAAVNAGEIPAGIIYHYYWSGPRGGRREQRQRAAALLRRPGPRRVPQRLGRRRPALQRRPRRGAEAGRYLDGRTGSGSSRTAPRWSTRSTRRSPSTPACSRSPSWAADVDINSLNGPKTVEMMQQAGLL